MTAFTIVVGMAAQTDRGVPLSTLSPKYLHSNSTSHTWPFSAIAELVDNAYDPDVCAKQFWIDKTIVEGQECLSFMDNGNGLDRETMHKMLSFGYSDKTTINGVQPIGMYGNGFKSGSMRLGKDAIVFSKSKSTLCVGMLSQTYLEKIGAKQIIVPIVCFQKTDGKNFRVSEEHRASLQDILRYSPFKSEKRLLTEINMISSAGTAGKTGTRIIVWNLRRTSTGGAEFDFQTDRYDIRIPSDVYEAMNQTRQPLERITPYVPESVYSLRAYCSILYLKPRMQVIIRSQKVKSELIAKSLAEIKKDHYKPTFLTRRIGITFGYNTKSKDHYGIMMYHKNRLIKAYERVGCQLKANNAGVGVIGVIECNFLDPTHNKQSFMENDKYRKTIINLGSKLEDYWKEIRYRKTIENPNSTVPVEDTTKRPDQNWVQCDECLRWRKLPDGIDCDRLPDKWFCHQNPDPQFRSCQMEEEPEDSDDDQPSYCKTYKLQEREDKKEQDRRRQLMEENRKFQEKTRLSNLAKQNEALRRQQEDLKQQLSQTTVHSPSAPTTPMSRFNTESLHVQAARADSSPMRSITISQAACSPSSSSGLPIITGVCSLSTALLKRKRAQLNNSQITPKRPKVNGFHRGTSDPSASVDRSPQSSPVVPINDSDDEDDDILILETASTPKPKNPGFDLTKVKAEGERGNSDAAVDEASETNAAGKDYSWSAAVGASPTPAVPPEMATTTTTTTQTEVSEVKVEEKDGEQTKQVLHQRQTEAGERQAQSTSNRKGNEQSSEADINICGADQRLIKQEISDNANSEDKLNQKGFGHQPDREEEAGPSSADVSGKHYLPSLNEVQQQQDQLLELMQATAQERDAFKEQAHELTCKLEDMQRKLQELSVINVKKEYSHQTSQTEETVEEKDYKSLFERTKQKVDELIREKETQASTAKCEKRNMDEIKQQVDNLSKELDQRTKERDGLRSQLDSLDEEKANLVSQCEELRLNLQQQREKALEGNTAQQHTGDSVLDRSEAECTANSDIASSSDTFRSLIELRHSIGRLLVTFVPALDLGQVNYECNVIDEILEQVLSDDSVTDFKLRNGSGKD